MVSPRDKVLLADLLLEHDAIRFGQFKLKSGKWSPIYVDLRILIAFPKTLRVVGEVLTDALRDLEFDRIAGIPYAGIPIVTAVALEGEFAAIYPRKEAKDYGTARAIEGLFNPGDAVWGLDDVITDGASKIEAAQPMVAAGLVVVGFVVLVDREQGGRETLAAAGYELFSVYTLRELVDGYEERGKIDAVLAESVRKYLDDPNSFQPAS